MESRRSYGDGTSRESRKSGSGSSDISPSRSRRRFSSSRKSSRSSKSPPRSFRKSSMTSSSPPRFFRKSSRTSSSPPRSFRKSSRTSRSPPRYSYNHQSRRSPPSSSPRQNHHRRSRTCDVGDRNRLRSVCSSSHRPYDDSRSASSRRLTSTKRDGKSRYSSGYGSSGSRSTSAVSAYRRRRSPSTLPSPRDLPSITDDDVFLTPNDDRYMHRDGARKHHRGSTKRRRETSPQEYLSAKTRRTSSRTVEDLGDSLDRRMRLCSDSAASPSTSHRTIVVRTTNTVTIPQCACDASDDEDDSDRGRPWLPAKQASPSRELSATPLASRHRSRPRDILNDLKPFTERWESDLQLRSRQYRHSFVDSHCHIDFIYKRVGMPRDTKYEDFRQSKAGSYPLNYEGCVAVFCDPATFHAHRPQNQVLQTVSGEPGIWLAIGCHPKHAMSFTKAHEEGLRKALHQPNVVALGEIGLDYSGKFYSHAKTQKTVFRCQLRMAIEMNLPLVIHCRDADDDCMDIMQEMVPRLHKIHLHCFTRDITHAHRWMAMFPNLYIGLTPLITYTSAVDAINTATEITLDRVLLETDAPYFVPRNLGTNSVHISHPGFALFTAERIGELKGVPVDKVLEACRNNTRNMYGI